MAANRHHLYFPKKSYKGATERKFRNLPCNVVWLDEIIHRILHQHSKPPIKPSLDEMHFAILRHTKGECSCYRPGR